MPAQRAACTALGIGHWIVYSPPEHHGDQGVPLSVLTASGCSTSTCSEREKKLWLCIILYCGNAQQPQSWTKTPSYYIIQTQNKTIIPVPKTLQSKHVSMFICAWALSLLLVGPALKSTEDRPTPIYFSRFWIRLFESSPSALLIW